MMTGRAAELDVGDGRVGSAGATRGYVCPARDQLFLMPVSMRDWLDEGHLAFFVLEVVGELDTSGLHRRPGGCPGRPPYEPEMMACFCTRTVAGSVPAGGSRRTVGPMRRSG